MAEQNFDLIVIGGGPGGYVAAIRAAQLGLKTACVDKRGALGGTCLNIGCIPSKALLNSSAKFAEARNGLARHGVKLGAVALDLAAMMATKDQIVSGLTKGIEQLFKKNKVEWVKGAGRLEKPGLVAIESGRRLETRNIVVATGSDSLPLPGVAVDEERIVTSTGALSLKTVPERLVVVGAGYIGLEMGSVWGRLGAKVTVIEFLDRVLPGMDGEVAKQFQRMLEKQGFAFRLGSKVTAAKKTNKGVELTVEPTKGGPAATVAADVVLIAIGRRPVTEGLGLDALGVALDERGRIKTDTQFRTNVAGLYAIGDVIAGPMLAHKAEEEGVAVAEIIAGQSGHVNYETVPGVVYTHPEVASVGKTEEELKAAGIDYRVGRFPFLANSRARAVVDTEGFVKILAETGSDRVLGVHIVGPEAGTVIHECVMAMEFGACAEDIARAFHAHPTLNEAVKEAALGVAGRAIHI
ncbi:MAG: dihydrolipoyl dehydrogenase [Pseudomonadota bacterium]